MEDQRDGDSEIGLTKPQKPKILGFRDLRFRGLLDWYVKGPKNQNSGFRAYATQVL